MGNSATRPAGYRVVDAGPEPRIAVQTFADYIVAVNGEPLDGTQPLAAILGAAADAVVELTVYNIFDNNARCVALRRDADAKFSLGVTVRFEYIDEAAVGSVLKVTGVKDGFPGDAEAHLKAHSDYVVAILNHPSPRATLANLHSAVEEAAAEGTPITLLVYSAETAELRQVTLAPLDVSAVTGARRHVLGLQLEQVDALPKPACIAPAVPWQLQHAKVPIGTQTDGFDYSMITM